MTDPIEIALEIRDKISELPEAKEYLRLKSIIDNDEEIKSIKAEIIALKKSGEVAKANELNSKLDSMPIIVNFNATKEQLADTLKVISNILK